MRKGWREGEEWRRGRERASEGWGRREGRRDGEREGGKEDGNPSKPGNQLVYHICIHIGLCLGKL